MDTKVWFSRLIRSLAGAALVVALPASGVAAIESTDSNDLASSPIKATHERGQVRLTTRLTQPVVAGQPTRVVTRVTNTGDGPIFWPSGPGSISVGGAMVDATWRSGEPAPDPGSSEEPGFKTALLGDLDPPGDRIFLTFGLVEVDGVPVDPDGGIPFPERLRPGQEVSLVHEWDGFVRLAGDYPSVVGLPPSGPVRVGVSAYYSELSKGSRGPAQGRKISVELEATVIDGRDEALLHPLEVVDAALGDPGFAELIEASDFTRYDDPYVAYDAEMQHWYVGSCGLNPGEDDRYWRLGIVDSVDGDVLGLIEGHGNETCEPGTWPGPESTIPRPSPLAD